MSKCVTFIKDLIGEVKKKGRERNKLQPDLLVCEEIM